MKMEKMGSSTEVPVPSDIEWQPSVAPALERSGGPAAMLVGALFLIVALPYWTFRLLGQMVWRDLRRVGRFFGFCGSTYLEALRRAP